MSIGNQAGELAAAMLGRALKRREQFDDAVLVGREYTAVVVERPGFGGFSFSVL